MIYLDNNATTRLDSLVLETMLPYLKEDYANASSIQHKMGRITHQAVEQSRKQIAAYLHVDPKEIFFTSGSTESISTVIKGIAERYQSIGNHIITCTTEHKDVLSTCEVLEKKGTKVTYLSVNENGQINLDELIESIAKETILVCLMSTNNETGVMHPIKDIAEICREKDILFFCDATQSIGKSAINLSQVPIDILCFSAHKFHGPKGIGGLFVRRKSKPIQIAPLITGGKQENGFRAGTYNVPAIVGMAKAIEMINTEEQQKVEKLRNYFEQNVKEAIEDCKILAIESPRVHNTSNIYFKHIKSSELMTKLHNIALSSGSACVSGDRDPSHVLKAMGLSDEDALSCIRFSFSKYNELKEVDVVISELNNAVKSIRDQSPIWQMYKAGFLD